MGDIASVLTSHLERLDAWLRGEGGAKLVRTLRQIVAAGVLLGPRVEWVEKQEASNPLWFVLLDLSHEWTADEEERWLELVFLAAKDEPRLVEVFDHVLIDQGVVSEIERSIAERAEGDSYPSRHLRHGLAHLAAREYVDAWPPLLVGLEGAIRAFATDQGVLDAEGRIANGHRPGVEGVYKRLGIPPYYERFLGERVYGSRGNVFRHGSAAGNVRAQMVYAAVAVAGWLDVLGDQTGIQALSEALTSSPALDAALADQRPAFDQHLDKLLERALRDTDQATLDFIAPLVEEEAAAAPE